MVCALRVSQREVRKMAREHDQAVEEFLAAFDQRLETAPVVERRMQIERRGEASARRVDGRRARGPVDDAFAYWESPKHDAG